MQTFIFFQLMMMNINFCLLHVVCNIHCVLHDKKTFIILLMIELCQHVTYTNYDLQLCCTRLFVDGYDEEWDNW